MPLWLIYSLCLFFFLVTGFLFIWAIREGGNFAFLRSSYWREKSRPPGANDSSDPARRSE